MVAKSLRRGPCARTARRLLLPPSCSLGTPGLKFLFSMQCLWHQQCCYQMLLETANEEAILLCIAIHYQLASIELLPFLASVQ